jgi:hypothetical protein
MKYRLSVANRKLLTEPNRLIVFFINRLLLAKPGFSRGIFSNKEQLFVCREFSKGAVIIFSINLLL